MHINQRFQLRYSFVIWLLIDYTLINNYTLIILVMCLYAFMSYSKEINVHLIIMG